MDGQDNLLNTDNARERQRRLELVSSQKGKRTTDIHTKRIMHRDVERQRRQEMTTLCASLRNLLPLEYIKGKRSISDHVQEAVNYIKDLENKIKQLGVKRDELKNRSNLRLLGGFNCQNSNITPTCAIMVRSCLVGVEVIVNCEFEEHAVVRLSRLLELLEVEGLNVVSCVSTKVNRRLMRTILFEAAGDSRGIDTVGLQKKLMEAIQLVRGSTHPIELISDHNSQHRVC